MDTALPSNITPTQRTAFLREFFDVIISLKINSKKTWNTTTIPVVPGLMN